MISLRPSGRLLPDHVNELLVSRREWGRRIATLVSAVLVGIVAIFFAQAGDMAHALFQRVRAIDPLIPLVMTPLIFVAIAAAQMRFAPEAAGSGIPQVIAASRQPRGRVSRRLVSLRAAIAKIFFTLAALAGGGTVGREGPTVQLGAAIMVAVHRLLRVPMTPGVLIAGGAAGVAAAFNTPLAGIAFAIEELAVAYEQRVAVLVMGAVMIAGLTAQGIAGNYVYFGEMEAGGLSIVTIVVAAPLLGIAGGILGGLFSRWMLALRGPDGRFAKLLGKRPLVTALVCGIVVALLGLVSGGMTSGTGYEPTRVMLEGGGGEWWYGPAKFAATLATSASGIAGGIFAPSLAVGAGFGQLMTGFFPTEQAGMIVLLGMAGYFTGVVRAPLTGVIILSEATGSSHAILPLFATALIGDWAGSMVCRKRLYHELAKSFLPRTGFSKAEGTAQKGQRRASSSIS
ncbi:chloride channel protein [Croceicoccus mobilis]|uniref:Chloride channel protein n=1 Tax=Croceicoccus mobilis TaxID=1703339 RepID=A0A916Z696_9SPHN|nr:chloride channel protein [Croceicoccus mobilis]GGD78584.1 chloride channel protein [Croceicoccus mobilis]